MRSNKLPRPSPEQVRAARKAADLSQTEASQLVSDAGAKGYRTWQRYEATLRSADHRSIPNAIWELFLLLTDQHPTHKMVSKDVSPTGDGAP
ncbi:hypothetical protein [Burkholderia multivorans]|uniref:hypothetical protein n=1 Tax=Burkholderia multivorans TaxID=87883 RepID=UPI0015888DFA|nr:hypothetical protein [Burkholderia multivorans]MDN8102629.1 hypothetical protein [Burkholderia multivorans]